MTLRGIRCAVSRLWTAEGRLVGRSHGAGKAAGMTNPTTSLPAAIGSAARGVPLPGPGLRRVQPRRGGGQLGGLPLPPLAAAWTLLLLPSGGERR